MKESFVNKTPETEKAASEALTFVMSRIEKLTPEGYFYGSKVEKTIFNL